MMDFLVVDETSMLDISLAASLLKAVPAACQVLFIGDPDQLPRCRCRGCAIGSAQGNNCSEI